MVLNENLGVSNENLGVSNENLGVPSENMEVPNENGPQRKYGGLQWKSCGPQWKYIMWVLNNNLEVFNENMRISLKIRGSPIKILGVSNENMESLTKIWGSQVKIWGSPMEILFPPAVQVQPRLPPALLALLELAGPLTKSIYTLLFCLSVCLPLCPFVSNKCQNGWTDRVQILFGTSHVPREDL